jgi:hypothetical protein
MSIGCGVARRFSRANVPRLAECGLTWCPSEWFDDDFELEPAIEEALPASRQVIRHIGEQVPALLAMRWAPLCSWVFSLGADRKRWTSATAPPSASNQAWRIAWYRPLALRTPTIRRPSFLKVHCPAVYACTQPVGAVAPRLNANPRSLELQPAFPSLK